MNQRIEGGKTIFPSEHARLRFLARQCPYNYGISVYIARRILKEVFNIQEPLNSCELLPVQNNQGNLRLAKVDELSDIIVYPNPVKDDINILFTSNDEGELIVRVYSAGGKVVLNERKPIGQKNTFELSNLPAGIFIYEIEVVNDKIYRGKIIKE